MEDLIGLLILLIFFGSKIFGSLAKNKKAEQPQKKTLSDWLEEMERKAFPIEEIPQVKPAPPLEERAEVKMPLHTPQPERTEVTSTTLQESSSTAQGLLGPRDLKRAIIMKENLGPPKARTKTRGPRL